MARHRVTRKKPGYLVVRGPQLACARIKNECQCSILPDEYQERAAKANKDEILDLLYGKLRCKCGASVGARKSPMGDFFAPTRHPIYKEPHGPRKRSRSK
jgi:hypothetical protein